MPKKLSPVHPGEILLQEAMKPVGLTANRLASKLAIPTSRVLEIIRGRRSISADTAQRLGRYFGTTAQLWMNLQGRYDLEVAEDEKCKQIERVVKPREVLPLRTGD